MIGQDGLRFDLRVVPPEAYGSLLQHFTGSKDHNVALREAAQRQGLSVSEYGVTEVETGTVHAFATEEEVYGFLGYAWIPPELRENCGELEAARAGSLPELVALGDLRGDLHTHTTWSDGKDTLEAMVGRGDPPRVQLLRDLRPLPPAAGRPARAAGRGDRPARDPGADPAAQGDRGEHPRQRRARHAGAELAGLDWVVASAHSSFDKDPTGRVLAAMENPYVDCIGHLTGRKIGRREPAAIDLERVIEKALETGTFLEINSQPDRLDLSDVHARAAREAGLKLVIDSDAHQTAALRYVELGVGQARRAWLTKEDVVNTHTWEQVEKLRKRRPKMSRELSRVTCG